MKDSDYDASNLTVSIPITIYYDEVSGDVCGYKRPTWEELKDALAKKKEENNAR
jgi:hypothetical protein